MKKSLVTFLVKKPAVERRRLAQFLFLATGAGVLATSYVHWRLWQGFGYRHIATIGNFFLAQIIAGVIITVATLFIHRVWTILVCAGFMASVLVGFLLAVTVGVFGFQDSWFAPFARTAFWLEVSTILLSAVTFFVVVVRTRRA